jgi:hypothetical protein
MDSEDGKSLIYTGERSYEWMLSFVVCGARARNNDNQAGTKSVEKYYLWNHLRMKNMDLFQFFTIFAKIPLINIRRSL